MTAFKKSISNKLKSIFTDSLSEEDRMKRYFIDYATSLVKKHNHTGVISLQIIQSGVELSALLFQGNTLIKKIALENIPLFFTNEFTASLIGASIVEEKLKKYFKTFIGTNTSKPTGIRMLLLQKERIKIYTIGTQNTDEVSLSHFITFFKS